MEASQRCTHHRLVKRGHELVCAECGLVISDFELSPKPRNYDKPVLWDYTSFTLGSDRLTSKQRTEIAVATRIDLLASRLMLPSHVSAQAMVEARKILRAVRGRAGVRLTAAETAITSVWIACKITKTPVSVKELARTLSAMGLEYDEYRIFRLLNRASRVMNLPHELMRPRDYIPKITAKLSRKAPYRYLSTVERYAAEIVESAGEELKGRNPVYSAAAAICVADEILGGWIGRDLIAEAASAGASLANLTGSLRRTAPPPPSVVRDLAFELAQKYVVEREVDVIVETIACRCEA